MAAFATLSASRVEGNLGRVRAQANLKLFFASIELETD
jgi:hypothetical protein